MTTLMERASISGGERRANGPKFNTKGKHAQRKGVANKLATKADE